MDDRSACPARVPSHPECRGGLGSGAAEEAVDVGPEVGRVERLASRTPSRSRSSRGRPARRAGSAPAWSPRRPAGAARRSCGRRRARPAAPRRRGTRGWRGRSRRRASRVIRSPVNAYSFASSRLVCSGQVSGPPSAATRPTVTCGSDEVRRLRHVDDVGERDDAAAETDGRPVDRGDHRYPAADHVEHELAALGDHVAAQRAVVRHAVEEIEVAAGRERAPFAGDDRDARVAVGAELREDAGQAEVQLVVDRVELLGARRAARSAPGRRPRRGRRRGGRSPSDDSLFARAVVLRPSAGRGSASRRCSSGSVTCRP